MEEPHFLPSRSIVGRLGSSLSVQWTRLLQRPTELASRSRIGDRICSRGPVGCLTLVAIMAFRARGRRGCVCIAFHHRPGASRPPVDMPALALAAHRRLPGRVFSGETVERYERETRLRVLEIHVPSTNLKNFMVANYQIGFCVGVAFLELQRTTSIPPSARSSTNARRCEPEPALDPTQRPRHDLNGVPLLISLSAVTEDS